MPKIPNVVWALILSAGAVMIQTYFPNDPMAQLVMAAVVGVIKALGVIVTVEEENTSQPPPGAMSAPNGYGGRRPKGFLNRWLTD